MNTPTGPATVTPGGAFVHRDFRRYIASNDLGELESGLTAA
jgi:hypothetical protein